MQNYLPARPFYDPMRTPYHIPREMKQNAAQFRCMFSQEYVSTLWNYNAICGNYVSIHLQYKGKPSEDQLRRWCVEVPCSVNLNLLNLCQIVKEERFQDRGTTDKKQMRIFSRFLRKIAVPLYKRNKSKFDIMPEHTNNIREYMFIQLYNFELLPSLTNCEHNSLDVISESSEMDAFEESSDLALDSIDHEQCEKSSSLLPEAQELNSQLTGTGNVLSSSSSLNDMLCSSSEMIQPIEVGISQPLLSYTQIMQDENLVTSTQQ